MPARSSIPTALFLVLCIASGCDDDDARVADPDAVAQAERAADQLRDANAAASPGSVHDPAAAGGGGHGSAPDAGAPAQPGGAMQGSKSGGATSQAMGGSPMEGTHEPMPPAGGGMGMDGARPPAGGGMGLDGMGGAMPPSGGGEATPPAAGDGPGMQGMDEAMPPMGAAGSGGSKGMMAMMGMCCGGGAMGGSSGAMAGMPSDAAASPTGSSDTTPGMTRAMGMGARGGKAMGKKGGALPGFPGASHLYHVGAVDFFLDRAAELRLTSEQSAELQRRKADALEASAAADARIVAAEQRLWALTGSDRPQLAKITATLTEVERLRTSQRLGMIRAVGEAAALLGDAQRACVSDWADVTTGLIEPTTTAPSTCPGVGS